MKSTIKNLTSFTIKVTVAFSLLFMFQNDMIAQKKQSKEVQAKASQENTLSVESTTQYTMIGTSPTQIESSYDIVSCNAEVFIFLSLTNKQDAPQMTSVTVTVTDLATGKEYQHLIKGIELEPHQTVRPVCDKDIFRNNKIKMPSGFNSDRISVTTEFKRM